jgi:hypothetical protein
MLYFNCNLNVNAHKYSSNELVYLCVCVQYCIDFGRIVNKIIIIRLRRSHNMQQRRY